MDFAARLFEPPVVVSRQSPVTPLFQFFVGALSHDLTLSDFQLTRLERFAIACTDLQTALV
jgi:hypothetical protein